MKKRILSILQLPPPHHGASYVGKMFKDSIVINSEFDLRYINSNLSSSTNLIGRFSLKKFFIYLNIIIRVLYELIFFRPDICYFSITAKTTGFFKDFFIGVLIKLFNNKIIFHFHNKGVSSVQNIFYYNFCYKILFKNSKAIILSERLYFDISNYFKREDVFICQNGIPAINNKSNKSSKIRLLFLSNLFSSKGVYELLEACKILVNKKVVFSCDFVGDEGDISKKDFERKANNLKINKHVIYHGKKYGAEKFYFFQNASIFIHPTFDDCFPIVLLEALNFKLPVITTNVGAIEDIVIDNYNGYVLKNLTSHSLAKSIILLSSQSKKMHSMSLNSNKLFNQKFQQNVFENNLKNILNSI